LFGGYPRYGRGLREWEQIRGLPVGLRRLLGGTLGALPVEALDRLSAGRARVFPAALGTKLRRAAERVGATSLRELYQALMSQWLAPERLLPDIASLPVALNETPFALREAGALSQMMYWDTVSYLPDSILVKVDRASMAVSLEAREPLLDYRLYEYLRSLPEALQAPPTTEKRLLRSVLYRYVPPKLIERPKMGFGIPLGAWLRGALREWAEALIAPAALRATGIEGIAYARSIWEAHQTGRADNEYALWTLLMYQAWHFARKEPLAWPKA
jgi:asparagine synthase (glutamine-hydrolysing)